jgi:iron complex transport system permease protein
LRELGQGLPSLAIGFCLGLLILLGCFILSLSLGAADVSLNQVFLAIFAFDGSTEHLIVTTMRLPRSLIAILVGASLGVSGAIMQGLTRNNLADPGILALDSGAVLAVVSIAFLFRISPEDTSIGFAFLGAALSVAIVYVLASLGRGGLNSLNLIIAGAVLSALFSSLTTAILILDRSTFEEIRFWLAGSVAGRDINFILPVLPFIVVGLLISFVLGKQIGVISLGEDIAKGLGQRTLLVKLTAAVCTVLLAGSSVAIAGSIGFVGLIVPHAVRSVIGVDYRWIFPYAAIFGAILLLIADLLARLALAPQELPVGVMTAIVGGPFFIYIARSHIKSA